MKTPAEVVNTVFLGDALEVAQTLPDKVFQCIITSTPYWKKRDYKVEGQIGLEDTPEAFVERLVSVFRELRRTLKDDGTLWLNIGDTYARSGGSNHRNTDRKRKTGRTGKEALLHPEGNSRPPKGLKEKDLIGIPWMLAFALRADGWYLRDEIIWHKPNPLPDGATDRCTFAHEKVFLLSKKKRYYCDMDAIKEPAIYAGDDRGARTDSRREEDGANHMNGSTGDYRNKRNVWTVPVGAGFKSKTGKHYAAFPERLIEPMILAGSRRGDICFDPFMGSGTLADVARQLGRLYCGSELSQEYLSIIQERLALPRDVTLF